MKNKKVYAFCLTVAMIASSFSTAYAAEDPRDLGTADKFSDVSGHWAAAAIEKWADYGVLNGADGAFRPDSYITRAEMATLLDNMMDYQVKAKNTFSDVPTGAWYESAVLKANAAGILNGDGAGHATPAAKITKEQAALMLARAFSVDTDQGKSTKFSDAGKISSWAKSPIFGMEAAGFIGGYNNQFKPQSNITRAEVVTIINNAVKAYYTTAGTYTDDVGGLAIIKAPDVIIKGAAISGDVIVAEGVAGGNATIDGAAVKGSLIVRGGGENSVVVKGGADVQSVKVEKQDGKIRIFADGVVIREVDALEDVILEGSFGSVTVSADAAVTVKGSITKLDLEADSKADIQSGTVTTLNLPSGASANIASSATVKTANITDKAKITGAGKITTANISGSGAVIEQKPDAVVLAEGASASIAGKPAEKGTVKSGSGGGGGSSYKPYTLDEITAGKVVRPFTLVGSYDGVTINNCTVNAIHTAYMWDAGTSSYKEAPLDSSHVVGNFAALYDINSDREADGALIVAKKDSATFWNPNMRWQDGAGSETDPKVSDETGRDVFNQEYKIPMGERLFTGYGLGDYSGTTDFNNIIDYGDETGATLAAGQKYYWPQHDYYNAKSNSTLTMLTNYKSYLQTTGSNCGPASALTVLEWFGQRGDLNDNDLVGLREKSSWSGGSMLKHMMNIFENLSDLGLTCKWKFYSSYDEKDKLYDSNWIQKTLASGSAIMVGWNSFGGHWQVIIGYDNMGTKDTADDVLILMDPYDTTDHRNDGYNIQSYQRLAYGLQGFDTDVNYRGTLFLVVTPDPDDPKSKWNYKGPDMYTGTGYTIAATSAAMNFGAAYGAGLEDNWISYRDTADDIYHYYPDTKIVNGVGDYVPLTCPAIVGPAAEDYRHTGDNKYSSYYSHFDIYHIDSDTNLTLLKNFKTTQQTTEWTCGLASALMNIEWFGKNVTDADNPEGLTEIDLAKMRQGGRAGATTVNGMEEVFQTLNEDYNEDWAWFSMRDLDSIREPDNPDAELAINGHHLDYGSADGGLIPYLLKEGIPMMIGWDEWGGHWQVIIGYDSMGTDTTQDDVLILADPYDTTDHNMDGYMIESFERLVFGWDAQFDEDYAFVVAFPKSEHEDVVSELGLGQPTPKAVN